jgi:hypothetical protein
LYSMSLITSFNNCISSFIVISFIYKYI